MLVEIKIPQFPESITEGTIQSWYKKVNDNVQRDENLIDLETDKAMMEITAPADGILKEILAPDNSIVHGGDVIARVETDKVQDKAAPVVLSQSIQGLANSEDPESNRLKPMVEKSNIPVAGSAKQSKRVEVEPPQPAAEIHQKEYKKEKRVPMSRLRLRIAERLKQSQNTAAILTTFNEINMKAVRDMRTGYQDEFQKRYNIKLGIMSFFIQAVVEALKKNPIINASIEGTEIIYHDYYDIGIAVSSERGLVVPVIRDAEKLSFAELENTIREFGERARENRLTIEELTGGTFTISNGGIFGSMLSTPILNPPQSAILGLHSITDRPVVEDGQIVIRPMMYAALSYDHRLIDGHEAVLFLKSIKDYIEDPARILLRL